MLRFGLLVLILLSPLAARADDPLARFGPLVSGLGAASPVATGDFDGDGKPDAAYLVAVRPATAGAALPHEVTVIGTLFGNKKLGNRGTPRALAIVHGNGALFLLTGSLGEDGDFFDTPIWNSDEPPVRTAARGSKDFVELRRHEPRLHNDAILVGTEAGIDMALYWNGRTYALYKPPEEP